MGGGESRPTFPSNEQWHSYESEKKEQRDNILQELEEKRDQNVQQIKEIEKEWISKVITYMTHCQDKSWMSRVFRDNNKCTEAKKDLMMTSIGVFQKFEDGTDILQNYKKIKKRF